MSTRRLCVGGSVLVLWVALLGVLALPALAAAPEAPGPVAVQSPVGATRVTLRGILSPHAEGHPGTYQFLYKKGSGSCEGEAVAPESPGVMLGFEGEGVSQELTGLEAGGEYTVCLRAETAGGMTVGPESTFSTARALETPTTTDPPGDITATGATLLGVLNPGAEAEAGESYEFRYRASATECEGENEVATPREATPGKQGQQVEATLTELQPNRQYTFCVVAVNAAEETAVGSPVMFKTSTEPIMVGEESFSEAGPHSVELSAQVNYGNEAGSYLFQYGTPAEFQGGSERSTGVTQVPASEGAVDATAQLHELASETEYEYRVVATNAGNEVAKGSIDSFTTQADVQGALPDGRVYEMVTPPENKNANLYKPFVDQAFENGYPTEFPMQAAASGEAVTYVADATVGGFGELGSRLGNQYVAERLPGGGWKQIVLQPPARRATFYQGFSPDLTTGILNSGGDPANRAPLTRTAASFPAAILYARHDLSEASNEEELYEPLVTSTIPRNRELLAVGDVTTEGHSAEPVFAGASADFKDLFSIADDDLTAPGDPLRPALDHRIKAEVEVEEREIAEYKAGEGPYPAEKNDFLYDWVAGQNYLVDVLPDGEVPQTAIFGASALVEPGKVSPDFSRVISPDGERAYWTDEGAGEDEDHIFLRLNPSATESPRNTSGECTISGDACTLAVSAGAARYWTSADAGRYAFYVEAGRLMRFDAATGSRSIFGGAGAGVEAVMGAAESGESAYVMSTAVLPEASPGEGGVDPSEGEPNVYLVRTGQPPAFVATLAPNDLNEAEPASNGISSFELPYGDTQAGLGNRTAGASPDGQTLVFQSTQSLPVVGFPHGYPNGDASEVYLYSAEADQLFCVSCSETGEPLHGGGIAAFLTPSFNDTHLTEWLADDGARVFFDARVPLVAGATKTQNVYEWEREGAGSCSAATARNGGCIYLLSGGTSKNAAWFIGASESGDDVFIDTRAQLTPEDKNENYNLFDARVGGVSPVSAPACTGTGCQGIPAPPPTFATPPSNTYSGVGNFPPPTPGKPKAKAKSKRVKCKKGFTRVKRKCVKKPKPKKSKKSDRRAK